MHACTGSLSRPWAVPARPPCDTALTRSLHLATNRPSDDQATSSAHHPLTLLSTYSTSSTTSPPSFPTLTSNASHLATLLSPPLLPRSSFPTPPFRTANRHPRSTHRDRSYAYAYAYSPFAAHCPSSLFLFLFQASAVLPFPRPSRSSQFLSRSCPTQLTSINQLPLLI